MVLVIQPINIHVQFIMIKPVCIEVKVYDLIRDMCSYWSEGSINK